MQQARSDHFVLAKLRRDVLKHGVAVGLRYAFGGLHQPVEFVSGQSQSQLQLVQGGHGKRSTKNKNAATGLWFSYRISPFRRMHTQRGAAGAIFWGAGPRHGVRLRTCSLASSSFTCNLARSAAAAALVRKSLLAGRRVRPLRTYHSNEPSAQVCRRTKNSPAFTVRPSLQLILRRMAAKAVFSWSRASFWQSSHRSAAMEESRSHLGRDSTSPGFVYRRQTFVL
jgi:hypothetical protein